MIAARDREPIRVRGVAKLEAYEAGTGTCRAAFKEWNSVWDDDGHDSGTGTAGLFTTRQSTVLGASTATWGA